MKQLVKERTKLHRKTNLFTHFESFVQNDLAERWLCVIRH